MPVFEYLCNDCEARFDCLVRGADVPVCPVCGSGDLKKLVSSFAFKSKGNAASSSCGGCSGGNCASCSH